MVKWIWLYKFRSYWLLVVSLATVGVCVLGAGASVAAVLKYNIYSRNAKNIISNHKEKSKYENSNYRF